MPGHDVYLLCPPRIQDPGLLSNDYWQPATPTGGTPIASGPGLDWLADGADAILSEHPYVSGFYSSYLPIAYANKNRAHHYNWQQLEVVVSCRGRVEAKYQPDRVVLKGGLYCYSQQLDPYLFYWPDEWPHPAATPIVGTYLSSGGIPLDYNRNNRRFSITPAWRTEHGGPVELVLDGMTIPLALEA